MFLKNRRDTSKSIYARIAIFASHVVTIGAEYVLAQKTPNARKLARNNIFFVFPHRFSLLLH
jgi:hypothetical protein